MEKLASKIESLLFISARPMSVKQLAGLLNSQPKEIKEAGDKLVEQYKKERRGIHIIKNGQKYQMVSSPENTKAVQNFIAEETTGDLSRPSLETLTIIAYRGPISKIDLDRIRGVNCSLILRNLLIRGLVEAKVDKEKDTSFYNVTFDFLRFLGVDQVSDLPDFEKLNSNEILNDMLGLQNEDLSAKDNDGESSTGEEEEDALGESAEDENKTEEEANKDLDERENKRV